MKTYLLASSQGKLETWVKRIYYRKHNYWHQVNDVIRKVEIQQDGLISIELKNGLKLYDLRSQLGEDNELYSFAKKEKVSEIREPNNYQQAYQRILDEFVLNQHLRLFSLNSGDVVMDAGANIGAFTINAASRVGPSGLVIAVEPEERNFELLKHNVATNGLANVRLLKKGVWSKKQTLNFYLDAWPGLHSVFESVPGCSCGHGESLGRAVEIEVDTVDAILQELGVKKLNFLKMDIEGAEIEALKGAEKTLATPGIQLVVEAGHVISGKQTYKTLVPWLQQLGFKIVTVDRDRQTVFAQKGYPWETA